MGAHRRAVALGGWSGTRVSTLATELPNTAPTEATWLGRGLIARGERRGVARLAWAGPRRTRAGVGGAGRAGAGGSHVGERAHMTGRTMDPLPSPAVAAAAEAEADEEADPPATGRARGPGPCVESQVPCTLGPPVGATPRLAGRREWGWTSWGQPLPTVPWDAALQPSVSAGSCGVAPGSFLIPPCRHRLESGLYSCVAMLRERDASSV